jgi:16S rRNA (cytosine1402-N4)-methyltransferase
VSDLTHKPVMLDEVLAALEPRPGGKYADGTVNGGGHAAALLAACSPDGILYGCDRDASAIAAARERLAEFAGGFELRQGNFAGLADWAPAGEFNGVLFDLGLSTRQLDDPERGFSFQADGPLDMRFDVTQSLKASDVVNGTGAEELAKILWELGGERDARRLARAIARERESKPFETTRQLAAFIERLSPRRGKKAHPATRVFQALRVKVNDEWNSLERGLVGALKLLKPGGRLAVITFNSAEDAVVKAFGRTRAMEYAFEGPVDVPELRVPRTPELRLVTRKAIKPRAREVAENPRARSAQLRVMERVMRDA